MEKMAKYSSQFSQHELYVATGTIAAHSNSAVEGFRQRDVRFLLELFSNWIESALPGHVIEVQNTQVSRYLQDLILEGFAKKVTRKGPPKYRLTRPGLIALLERITNSPPPSRREDFLFLFYFVKTYRPRILALIEAEGRQFPHALRIEIEELLDSTNLLATESRRVASEVEKLKVRIRDAKSTIKEIRALSDQDLSTEQIIAQVEQLYPYELNSQKPLSELMADIPEESRLWELDRGNIQRIDVLWGPSLELLIAYAKVLEYLKGRE
jgi:hypothetical protein